MVIAFVIAFVWLTILTLGWGLVFWITKRWVVKHSHLEYRVEQQHPELVAQKFEGFRK